MMVLSIINFIQSCEEKNIVKYLKGKIESQKLSTAYKELIGIYAIGPKISSLILRDTYCIYEFNRNFNNYKYLFPIDTWIHQISLKMKIVFSKKNYKDEPQHIVNKCFENEVDPKEFNQGIWYIGTHSLDLLLRYLQNSNNLRF